MTNPSHPGLGEGTDISAADLDVTADAPVPASSDADQLSDPESMGTGDGADTQPGGSG